MQTPTNGYGNSAGGSYGGGAPRPYGGAPTAGPSNGPGLQMPGQGLAFPGRPNGVGNTSGAQAGPSQAQSGGDGFGEEKASKHTNVDQLMDAVGAAGVDLNAEEEQMNLANNMNRGTGFGYGRPYGVGGSSTTGGYVGPAVDRSRKQDFIDTKTLSDIVTRIAGTFQLRSLEPDTIPFLGLAVRHRLANIIEDAIIARNHRIHSHHLRPAPARPLKRKATDGGEEEEYEGAWDELVYDDIDAYLEGLARTEGDSERAIRRARVDRDQREQEEAQLGVLNGEIPLGSETPLTGQTDGTGPDGGPSATGAGGAGDGKEAKPKKEKKKKKEGPGVTARNMSEDARKKLSDKVAAHALSGLGGRKFSWLAGGAAASPGGKGGPGGQNGLPKPKFGAAANTLASGSALPPPTFLPSGQPNAGSPVAGSPTLASAAANANGALSMSMSERIALVPGVGQATLDGAADAWMGFPHAGVGAKNGPARTRGIGVLGEKTITLKDVLFAMEKERGSGSGRGSGEKALISAHARGRRRD